MWHKFMVQELRSQWTKVQVVLVLVIGLTWLLTGCESGSVSEVGFSSPEEFFVTVQVYRTHEIVYDPETKVMYSMSASPYNYGVVTPLYNSDGSLRTYTEKQAE